MLVRYVFNGKVLTQKLLNCADRNGLVQVPGLKELTLYVEKSKEDLLSRSNYVKSYCLQASPQSSVHLQSSDRQKGLRGLTANDF